MIQLTPHMRILAAVEPVDFRKGIDGLARVCREALSSDPFEGTVFLFRSRRATAIRFLVYDGRGFWLCHHRLSKGRFRHWPSGVDLAAGRTLEAHEVHLLLSGGDPQAAGTVAPMWRPIQTAG